MERKEVVIYIAIAAVIWIAAFVLIAGWSFAYSRGRWPTLESESDASFSLMWAFVGAFMAPLTVPMSYMFCACAKYGWKWPSFK